MGGIEYYRWWHSPECLAQSKQREAGEKQPTEQQMRHKMGKLQEKDVKQLQGTVLSQKILQQV